MNKKNRNKKRSEKGHDENKQCGKTFDKKKYRLQKYSNKYKIDQWEERRKKAVIRGFYKELEKGQQSLAQTSSDLANTSKNVDKITSKCKKNGYAFHKAWLEHRHKIDLTKKKMEEAARIRTEREEALKKYKEKKTRNFKVLSQKTKKGQPVMKGRIEMLLEKIQQSET